MGGYELTLELHGARLEIEADDVDELEEKLAAVDVARLESLIAGKRVAVSPTVAPVAKPAKKKTARKKTAKKSTKRGGKKATKK